jgi:hypothetical protein
MLFTGRVQRRSSEVAKPKTGPPGEAEIQRLNPHREQTIRSITRWESLAPGSLNLLVEDAVVTALADLDPTLEEPASTIVYPSPYQHIPKIREAYWYYAATARKGGKVRPVLVRRAKVPVPGVVELFSAESLREALQLVDGDVVGVELREKQRSSDAGA